jgi:hypothetical protein
MQPVQQAQYSRTPTNKPSTDAPKSIADYKDSSKQGTPRNSITPKPVIPKTFRSPNRRLMHVIDSSRNLIINNDSLLTQRLGIQPPNRTKK